MTAMPEPGVYVLLALTSWTIGGLLFLAAGAFVLATAIRNHRHGR